MAAAVGTQGVADVNIASNTKFIGFGVKKLANTKNIGPRYSSPLFNA